MSVRGKHPEHGRRKHNKNNYTIVPAPLGIEPNIEYMNAPAHGRNKYIIHVLRLAASKLDSATDSSSRNLVNPMF